MLAVCFNVVLLITSLHRKCIITEPKLMKIKRDQRLKKMYKYNNPQSIIVMMKSTIINVN